MRPAPEGLTVITAVYAALLCVVVKFQAWRPEFRRYWRRGRPGNFFAVGLFLMVVWLWVLFSTPAPATGDPRSRGGYSPAEQRELVK